MDGATLIMEDITVDIMVIPIIDILITVIPITVMDMEAVTHITQAQYLIIVEEGIQTITEQKLAVEQIIHLPEIRTVVLKILVE